VIRIIAVLLIGVIFLVGCTTLTQYHKSVTVEKDGEGKIIKTTIVEEIHQPDLKRGAQEIKYLDQ